MENCRRFGLHPEQYLTELLVKLAANRDPQLAAKLTPASLTSRRPEKSSAA